MSREERVAAVQALVEARVKVIKYRDALPQTPEDGGYEKGLFMGLTYAIEILLREQLRLTEE